MKNKLALALIICICSSQLFAQTDAEPGNFAYGFKAGLNIQNIVGISRIGDDLNGKWEARFHVGGFIEVPLKDAFYFQPGLQYISKGAKITDESGTVNTRNISYLEVPLHFVYKPVSGTSKWVLGAGPYVGFGIGGTSKTITSNNSYNEKLKFTGTIDSSDPLYQKFVAPIDFGFDFSVGMEVSSNILVQVEGQFGMINVTPKSSKLTNDKSKGKNIGFGISVGYRLEKK